MTLEMKRALEEVEKKLEILDASKRDARIEILVESGRPVKLWIHEGFAIAK
jgi:hypothetical protein